MRNGKHIFDDRVKAVFLAAFIWLLAFQNALECLWGAFTLIDESVALLGVALLLYDILYVRKCRLERDMLWIGASLAVFVIVGISGNALFRYQPLSCVVTDLYTNLKFFFAIAAGFYFFKGAQWDALRRTINLHAKAAVMLVLVVFLVDRVFQFYPSEVRMGIRSAKLFFEHQTYLAGSMVFLVMLLTAAFEKKNMPFIAAALIVLAFTMRGKALGGVLAWIAIITLLLVFKGRVKLWHFGALGVLMAAVGWPQIRLYFINGGGKTTRSVMHTLGWQIMKDYFPIGTGFGTFASSEAAKHFSPVYELYDLEYLLRFDSAWRKYLNDTFWPIIMGQTGAIGTVAYLAAMGWLFHKIRKTIRSNAYIGAAALFGFAYILICFTAESAFNNSVAVALAVGFGLLFSMTSGGADSQNQSADTQCAN